MPGHQCLILMFIQKSGVNVIRCNMLTTKLMGLPEWQCELDFSISYEFNMVHLNF